MENHIILDYGRGMALPRGIADNRQQLVDLQPRINKQGFIVVKLFIEEQKMFKRSIDWKSIGHGNCAKVIDHKIYARTRRHLADHQRLGISDCSDGCRLVFEIAGGAPLVCDCRSFGRLMDPPFSHPEIERSGSVIGKAHVAQTALNYRRFDWHRPWHIESTA